MTENIEYFRIKLENSKGLISIHEERELSPNDYHLADKKGDNNYQILVEAEKEIGNAFYSLNILPEKYKTYEFQDVTYQRINDYDVDGFEYDLDRKVVFYGWIYGVYAIKKHSTLYDVVTGDEIPWGIISNVVEMETVEDFEEMIEDLKLIKKHKNVYENIIKEIILKLSEGAMNKTMAYEKYKQNYDTAKKAQDQKRLKSENFYQQMRDQLKITSYPKREEVKKLIYEIKNN